MFILLSVSFMGAKVPRPRNWQFFTVQMGCKLYGILEFYYEICVFQGTFRVAILAPMPPYAGVFSWCKDKSFSGDVKHSTAIFCLYRTCVRIMYGNHIITARHTRFLLIVLTAHARRDERGIGGGSVIMVSDRVVMVAFAGHGHKKKPD